MGMWLDFLQLALALLLGWLGWVLVVVTRSIQRVGE